MSEEHQVEVEVVETTAKKADADALRSKQAAGMKAVESVGNVIGGIVETLEVALSGRGNTVMVRVNDEALEKLDMLVAAGICKSRSESAAFLLQRGIEASAAMYERIGGVTAQPIVDKVGADKTRSAGHKYRRHNLTLLSYIAALFTSRQENYTWDEIDMELIVNGLWLLVGDVPNPSTFIPIVAIPLALATGRNSSAKLRMK